MSPYPRIIASPPPPTARHYHPTLSIWLSVDPMSDKYPGVSPYAYCGNNPVRLVDPNGEDIWTIDADGKIQKEHNTQIDRIDVKDANGNIIRGTEAKYGTIKQHSPLIDGKKADLFDINDDIIATETFENIANNTNIEWTHAKIGKEVSNRNIVGTSHDPNKTSVGRYLLETKYTLRSITHNHPSGNGFPSKLLTPDGTYDGDLALAKKYEAAFPNVKLSIYVNGKSPLSNVYEWYEKGYHPYNSMGPILQNATKVTIE